MNIPDAELISHFTEFSPPGGIEMQLGTMDTPSTRSFFTVAFKCSWDDDHQLRFDARNGKLQKLSRV